MTGFSISSVEHATFGTGNLASVAIKHHVNFERPINAAVML
jgi:hypothetical protein